MAQTTQLDHILSKLPCSKEATPVLCLHKAGTGRVTAIWRFRINPLRNFEGNLALYSYREQSCAYPARKIKILRNSAQ
jgi:hypothetical protein